jgi:hypothetical protein
MNEEQRAAFQKLEDSGYLPRLRDFAMSKCAPFFWSSQEAGQPPKILAQWDHLLRLAWPMGLASSSTWTTICVPSCATLDVNGSPVASGDR